MYPNANSQGSVGEEVHYAVQIAEFATNGIM